jgi:hypothetical protein
MARLDVQAYRDMYLKEVEDHLMGMKDSIPNFTTENLHRAMMEEMNRADEETWEVEVPDDRSMAIKEAEQRAMDFMKTHKDMSNTKTF